MADFYGTVADADAYHLAHGNTGWTGTDTVKAQALLKASEWIDGNYSDAFPGYPTAYRAQVRQWPRTGAYDIYEHAFSNTEIPTVIPPAVYEAALRELVSPGSLFVDWTPGTDIKQLSVDGAVSLTFAGATTLADVQMSVATVDMILRVILTGSQAGISSLSGRTVRQ